MSHDAGFLITTRDRAGFHGIGQRSAGEYDHQHGQRKKCGDRERQKTRRSQPNRRQQGHPAKNNRQPAGIIQHKAAFRIQNLHPVLDREQKRRVVGVQKTNCQNTFAVEKVRGDFKLVIGVR